MKRVHQHHPQLRRSILGPLIIGAGIAALLLAFTHPKGAIISFDEGFHGQAALFLVEEVRWVLHLNHGLDPRYLPHELANGVTLYPPLWTLVAASLGLIFGPSTAIFRLATSLFYVGTIIVTFVLVDRATGKRLAAIASAALLATMPMVMIYSHLMMLEVPLLLGATGILSLFYLYALELIPHNYKTFLLLLVMAILGVLAKLPVFPLVWAIIVSFVVFGSILFWRQRFYRYFLKPELLIVLGASLLSITGTIKVIEHFFHVNMVDFFVNQSQGTNQDNPVVRALVTSWTHRDFYLRDFKHMPILSLIWFGSVIGYGVWKRSPFSLFLVLWALITYAAFSAVNPQVPQYLMAIYAPLAIATGVMVVELADLLGKFFALSLAKYIPAGLVIVLCFAQIMAMPHSEGYGWRHNQTGQDEAANLIARQAKRGDRVLSWHDGATYAIRIAGYKKDLQIDIATTQVCSDAMRQNFEWALVVNQPPPISSLDETILTSDPWQKLGAFGSDKSTFVYHNVTSWPFEFQPDIFNPKEVVEDKEASDGKALLITNTQQQPAYWGCLRLLPFGTNQAAFRLKTQQLAKNIADADTVLRIEYSENGYSVSKTITAKELRSHEGYQDFTLAINHERINRSGEFRIFIFRPATILFDSVRLSPSQ